MQTHVHWVSDALQPSHPLPPASPLVPSVFPSIRVFSSESALQIKWPKYWSFSFSISLSNEYSGLISFRVDLLLVQRTLKGLHQHHNLKASILWCSVLSNTLQSHGLQHARLPCPSPSPGAHTNSRSLSRWCYAAILSSVVPFSSCLQSFLASGSFQMSQFFTPGSQSIGVSASTSVLPVNTQDWSPLRWTGWISLHS